MPLNLYFKEVTFRTDVGQSDHKSIQLRNAGNIPMEVTLEVTHWPDFFTVTPQTLRIEPGCGCDVIVKFRPEHANARKFERYVDLLKNLLNIFLCISCIMSNSMPHSCSGNSEVRF